MSDKKEPPLMGCLSCGELTYQIDKCPRCGGEDLIGPLEPTNAAHNLAQIRAENWE